MDENLLAREASGFADCPQHAQYPKQAEEINEHQRDERIKALFKCLQEKWDEGKPASKKSPDKQFFDTFKEVITEAWQNQNYPDLSGVQKTKVLDLYHTEFVQANQPDLHQLFPSASAGICGLPRTTEGKTKKVEKIEVSIGTTSANHPQAPQTLDEGLAMANGQWVSDGEVISKEATKNTGLPECNEISTYPGGCDPKKSAFACYSLETTHQVEPDVNVEVHWACSEGLDQKDINDHSCSLRPWNFDGEHGGKHMTFTVDPGIYAGACQFSTLSETQELVMPAEKIEKSPAGVTTPETLAQAATTPERTTPEPVTPEPTTLEPTTTEQEGEAATTPEQPATSPTTTKNGAAGNSLRSWFTAVFLGLAVHYMY